MSRRNNALFICVLTASLTGGAAFPLTVHAAPKKQKRADIYDTKADGEKQIAQALSAAKRDNKRVLLQFGANWCGWCHKMHELFKTDPAVSRKLMYEYELVLIDVDTVDGKQHNEQINTRLGNPIRHGLPVFVVLDADGKQLTTQETEAFEVGDHHDPEKVLAFLTRWQPKPVSAEETLARALSRAKSESKNVFVHYSAPWCGWCRRMDAYLQRREIAEVFTSAFVPVKIDVDRMTGGTAMGERYGKGDDDGIPFFVILDTDGKKLADSRGPKGNCGFPAEDFEIEHFMAVMRQTAKQLTSSQLTVLERGLQGTH